jgi:hypothetical protein
MLVVMVIDLMQWRFSQRIGFMLGSRGSIVVLSVAIIKSVRIGQQEEAAVLA